MPTGVLVTGTGTYSTRGRHFRHGFTPCSDQNILKDVRDAKYRWVEVTDRDDLPSPAEQDEAVAADTSATNGALTKDNLKRAGFTCRVADCDKVLANASGRLLHERAKHPDFTPPTEDE